MTEAIEELLEADAFLHPDYTPKDEATVRKIKELARGLGLPNRQKDWDCLSSFVVACRSAEAKGGNLIAIPGDKHYYTNRLFGRDVAIRMRQALTDNGKLKLVQKAKRGSTAIYSFNDLELDGRFTHKPTWLIRIRESKPKPNIDGRLLSPKEAKEKFKHKYHEAEERVKSINAYYRDHPLCSEDAIFWTGVYRVFNDGRMDCGGRMYGDWQHIKEEDRLQFKIDGEEVVEIDITACFLFVASARAGTPISNRDPYATIPWVKTDQKRKLAKRLVSALLSREGPMSRFPRGVREEFGITKREHLNDYLNPLLKTFPVLVAPPTSGLQIMFQESEIIFKVIEELSHYDITAYPVHDCLIVPRRHKNATIRILFEIMDEEIGCRPWLTVGFKDGREEIVDPETF